MNRKSIIHFVGFTTRLSPDNFISQWSEYARQITDEPNATLQSKTNGKTPYHFISQHECQEEDFRFSFMKGRNSENFPEQSAKVIELGGYSPIVLGQPHSDRRWETKVLMFLTKNGISSQLYLSIHNLHPNIYEPFYENCLYSNIVEFATVGNETLLLMEQLKKNEDMDMAIYTRCSTPLFSYHPDGSSRQ